MAIAFDASSSFAFNNVVDPVLAHTCAADATILFIAVAVHNANSFCNNITGVDYAGANATLVPGASRCQCNTSGNLCHTLRIYFVGNPAGGLNNITVTSVGWATINVLAASFTGTAIANPVTGVCTNGQAAGITAMSCSATGVINGWYFYAMSTAISSVISTFAPGVLRRTQTDVGGRVSAAIGDENFAAGGLRSHTFTWVTAGWPNIIGLGMRPAIPSRGRVIKYFYDFFSPEPKVRDEKGRVVPPNEIRPDEWIEAEGLALPTMELPESAIQDPGRSRIIEINASDRAASIKTSTSQFAQVLIERAAAGRG